MTLPVSENWIADYTNSRCYRNYQVDSGWQFSKTITNNTYFYSDYGSGATWNNNNICTTSQSSCIIGNTTYYKGSLHSSNSSGEMSTAYYYYIKKIDNLTEYKAFSSF